MSVGPSAAALGEEARRGVGRPVSGRGGSRGYEQLVAAAENRAAAFKRRLERLALDIHDGPMQNLTVIGLDLDALRARLRPLVPDAEFPKVEAGVGQIVEELVEVERDLRALLTALEQGQGESVPLEDAIEAEIAEFERKSSARVELIVDGSVRTETDSQRRALQAIVAAALANVAKHAGARNVTIRLAGTEEAITLEIEDDGCGFDVDAALRPGHFGLSGMRERASLLGGHTEIRSRPGGPTVVTTTLEAWRPPGGRPRSEIDAAEA